MTTVGVKLDDEIRERLKALGTIKRRTAHWLMREAIREYLDREEAIEARNREADHAWEAYLQSGQFRATRL
ncbi:MAG: ribbon-helix-helix protein, CopG family [Beggiatoa sp.]|nr:ribbon-helix-helix protein, CopG family [Beggiatoa sp.]